MKSHTGTAPCVELLPAVGSWCRARWKLVAFAAAVAASMPGPAPYPGEIEAALRRALEVERSLRSDGADAMHWIDGKGLRRACWSGGSRVALLARRSEDEPRDVYLARIESTPEGAPLRLCDVYNLTNTELADEARLAGDGARLAWLLEAQQRSYRLETANMDAGDPAELAAWSQLERWQWRLTELQQSGQLSAIARRSFRIEPAADQLTFEWVDAGVSVLAQGRTLLLADPPLPASDEPHENQTAPLREEERAVARPGNLVTWAVDRARASPRIGSERLQWLKATAFALDARLERLLAAAAPTALPEVPDPEGALFSAGEALTQPLPAADASASDRWPPAPLAPLWSPALEGEGEWRSLAGDPFVREHPGLAPPFTTTFIRSDPRLETARVVVVVWDPRRADLHFVAGTEEPRSATGEIGSGLIPRSVLPRLLGAFNGGFQTVHGRFGTQVDGKLLSIPRPYAATVARFADGAVGLGTWPLASSVPPELDSFRQNLTPLVGGGVFNPYGRQWWGGAPIGWKDVARTVRSALCETQGGLLAYFYGSRVDHEALGAALLMARCRYGLHLDMNAGHTGFEFYSVIPSTEPALPQEALDVRWKVEAPVLDLPGWRFRSRRLFRNMQLMHFPRYIERQARDFFYLTERTLLPTTQPAGAQDATRQLGPIATDAGGFPQLATIASVRPDAARPDTEVRLLALDLKWLSASLGAAGPAPRGSVVSVSLPDAGETERALWVGEHRARVGGGAAIDGHLLAKEVATGAHAAWGLIDEEILIYAEVVTARDAARDSALLDRVLEQAGAGKRLPVSAPNFIAIKGETDLRGQRVDLAAHAARGEAALHFQPDAWQALRPLFADTPIVDPETWQPHQVEP